MCNKCPTWLLQGLFGHLQAIDTRLFSQQCPINFFQVDSKRKKKVASWPDNEKNSYVEKIFRKFSLSGDRKGLKPMWGLIGFLVLLFSSSSALSMGPCIETDPEFCGTYYERSETEAALAHIYNTFHPQDCATARFFVATGKHLSCGVGCWTHVQSYSLAIALS